jgi:hypothetical protein
MDVVGLKDSAQVGPVRLALSQALEGRFLVAEGLQERERELAGVERPLGERRYGLFNLNGVHTDPSRTIFLAAQRSASSGSTGSSTTSLQTLRQHRIGVIFARRPYPIIRYRATKKLKFWYNSRYLLASYRNATVRVAAAGRGRAAATVLRMSNPQ